ncbi:MAG: hypothetical protein U9R08_00965 [Nanoarchaeota archaeon]|nr:hypothetical protein [Nanoarchaeota archaeon]
MKEYTREVIVKDDKLKPYIEKKEAYLVKAKEITKKIEDNNEKLKDMSEKLMEENQQLTNTIKQTAQNFNEVKKDVVPLLEKIEKKEQSSKFEVLEEITIKDGEIVAIFTDVKEKAGHEFLEALKNTK